METQNFNTNFNTDSNINLFSIKNSENFPYVLFSIGATVLIFIGFNLGSLILYYIFQSDDNQSQSWFHGLSSILFLFIPTLISARYLPLQLKDTFIFYKFDKKILILLVLIFIGVQLCISALQTYQDIFLSEYFQDIYFEIRDYYNKLYSPFMNNYSIGDYLRSIIIAALLPAIIEELLFRGFLLSCLRKRIRTIYALIITSIIFAVLHFNPISLSSLLLIAFILGYITVLTNSIFPAMIIHFINNLCGILFSDLDNSNIISDYDPIITPSTLIIGVILIIFPLIFINKNILKIHSDRESD